VVALIQPAILVSTNQGLPVLKEAWVHLPEPCEHSLPLLYTQTRTHPLSLSPGYTETYAMFRITC